MRRLRKTLLLVLSLSLPVLPLGCGSASAAEATYQITETELTKLEQNLSELSTVNSEQRERLTTLQTALTKSQEKLTVSEAKSIALSTRLAKLSEELTAQVSSLETANKLLQEYEREERRTRQRIKRQRNLAYILAAIAVGVCIAT